MTAALPQVMVQSPDTVGASNSQFSICGKAAKGVPTRPRDAASVHRGAGAGMRRECVKSIPDLEPSDPEG
jgi:hypothetical protein